MDNSRQPTKLFFSLLFVILGISASGKPVIDVALSQDSTQRQSVQPSLISSECSLDERKTVGSLKEQQGKIERMGDSYRIISKDTILVPCNLPDAFKQDGKIILFSGDLKEVYPNERWAGLPFKITDVKNFTNTGATPQPVKSSLQRLANGNYKVCSEPPSTSIDKDKDLITGYCFAFRKSGNRVVGNYYDTKTLGEEGVCMSGTLSNSTIRGEAIEAIGSIGRQNTPQNSSGRQFVNWDTEGYLKVARASVIRTYGAPLYYKTVRYRSALLNLDSFYRYNAGTQSPPRNCLKQ
ncbi:MAG: hypothetical protein KME08_18840 [Aphanothece sp. CMT-3BRIN-NPC111]|jgi:hypothetical protein|nr:hypothetical protein [Aphanothece sp. CMT-3BRIN-NPC111]